MITEQYVNVRVISTGMGQDGSDTVQYFNGTDWIDYLTVYQFEDNMKSKRDKTVDALRRKYDVRKVYQIPTGNATGAKYRDGTKEEWDALPFPKHYRVEAL
jgi:hypothetical protein